MATITTCVEVVLLRRMAPVTATPALSVISPDLAKQLMVTPCGHLLCWPCLLQWLHAQSPFSGPVCKVEVLMETNVTPLYGRGGEEGDSPTNNDLPPARPEATNGGHKKAVDTKLG